MKKKSPNKGKQSQNEQIATLGQRYVLPTYGRAPLALVKGKGSWVWDADGKKYLDLLAGIAVNNLGHAPAAIAKVIREQSGKMFHCSNLYHIPEQIKLAQELVNLSGLHQAFFCNSGTEAVEACIKLARYWGTQSQSSRYEIIVTENSFHGRTLGALSATGQSKYQEGFGPLVPGFKHVPFGDLQAISQAITATTCAVLLEPIQCEGGLVYPQPGFLKALKKLTEEKNILLILDEVQTGVGRTGKMFAHQHEGVQPDLMALAKGLGSGFPIGACLAAPQVAAIVKPGIHASTFGGNPLASRAALETLKIVGKKSFLKQVESSGAFFIKELEKLKTKHSLIKSVRGQGLLVACDLHKEVGADIVKLGMEEGVLLNVIKNKIIRFVPPLTITKEEIRKGIQSLDRIFSRLEGAA